MLKKNIKTLNPFSKIDEKYDLMEIKSYDVFGNYK